MFASDKHEVSLTEAKSTGVSHGYQEQEVRHLLQVTFLIFCVYLPHAPPVAAASLMSHYNCSNSASKTPSWHSWHATWRDQQESLPCPYCTIPGERLKRTQTDSNNCSCSLVRVRHWRMPRSTYTAPSWGLLTTQEAGQKQWHLDAWGRNCELSRYVESTFKLENGNWELENIKGWMLGAPACCLWCLHLFRSTWVLLQFSFHSSFLLMHTQGGACNDPSRKSGWSFSLLANYSWYGLLEMNQGLKGLSFTLPFK